MPEGGKARLKSVLKRLSGSCVTAAGRTRAGRVLGEQFIGAVMKRTRQVTRGDATLVFTVPNALNTNRVDTFATKEPETLEWIDSIPRGAVCWDVGANVGLYTCYLAKARGCLVIAFEPSVFNLELLARNVFLNGLTDRVTIVPLPLSDGLAVSRFAMTSTEWGGALSSFGQAYGYDGKPINETFAFSTIGLSADQATRLLALPLPDYIKLDVDGIEHLILKGGADVLRHVQGVLIEINDDFRAQSEDARRLLSQAGLTLKAKHRWAGTNDSPFAATYNQIWYRHTGA